MASVTPSDLLPGTAAVLRGACDGYRAGTTGRLQGSRQGCIVFVPDEPAGVARWARPRSSMLVPPAFIATVRS
jgi:hypothetical protein